MENNSYHHGDLKNALIQAGIEIITQKGLNSLSLRSVAKKAGVSHSAPYAHFADKQALFAAIATAGHDRIKHKILTIIENTPQDPVRQLVETAFVYLDFGMEQPDLFRLTFSDVIEQERDYPALVQITQENFSLIKEIVGRCCNAGAFSDDPADLLAQTLWSAVHGTVSLIQQGQVSSILLNQYSPQEMILFTINKMTKVEINAEDYL